MGLPALLRELPRDEAESRLRRLSPTERIQLFYDWKQWARPDQIEPDWDWLTWLVLPGRGWGKTRVGAEQVRHWVKTIPLVNLIGATVDDARDIMIEGESGILRCCPPWERPRYVKNERKLIWPNGNESLIFTADEPDRLRGKQHMKLWGDEPAAWRYAQDAWDQASLGLRLGPKPQAIMTTTPRPTAFIKSLAKDETTHVTNGTTYDNAANLAPAFMKRIVTRYEGSRLGRQEIGGEILDDNPNALFQRAWIDKYRITLAEYREHITAVRKAIGVDPSVTAKEDSDLCGIVGGSLAWGIDGRLHVFILEDKSDILTPRGWAQKVVSLYHTLEADRVIAEINNGGDLVETIIRTVDANIPYHGVHATRGKIVRAEPVSTLYEQGRIHHVGSFPKMEDEMCEYDPVTATKSPDRMDALVWLVYGLALGPQGSDYSILGAGL